MFKASDSHKRDRLFQKQIKSPNKLKNIAQIYVYFCNQGACWIYFFHVLRLINEWSPTRSERRLRSERMLRRNLAARLQNVSFCFIFLKNKKDLTKSQLSKKILHMKGLICYCGKAICLLKGWLVIIKTVWFQVSATAIVKVFIIYPYSIYSLLYILSSVQISAMINLLWFFTCVIIWMLLYLQRCVLIFAISEHFHHFGQKPQLISSRSSSPPPQPTPQL